MSVARIKQKAEEADQIIQGLREGNAPPDDQPTEQAATPEQDQGVVSESTTEQEPQGEPSQDGPSQDEAQLWEQRYRSLNGMIQSRDKQIQQLHELLANMQQAQSRPQEQPQGSTQQESLITKDDEDSYGADLVDMARRAGRQESMQLIDELRAELNEMRRHVQGVTQVTQVSAKERFESKLDDLTNNTWRTTDADPGFMEWLKVSNSRRKVFAQGVQDQDAATLAEFFNDYVKLATVHRAEAARPTQARKTELERQVAPGKSKAGATPISQAGDKKQWTRSEIGRVYANKKQYTADEFNKLEREIAAAQRDGRVDFGR